MTIVSRSQTLRETTMTTGFWTWRLIISVLEPGGIPRFCYGSIYQEVKAYHLIVVFDASLRGYAGMVYLLLETDSEQNRRFLTAKTRDSLSSRQTITRLELLSALLLAKLMTNFQHALTGCIPLDQSLCFTLGCNILDSRLRKGLEALHAEPGK